MAIQASSFVDSALVVPGRGVRAHTAERRVALWLRTYQENRATVGGLSCLPRAAIHPPPYELGPLRR